MEIKINYQEAPEIPQAIYDDLMADDPRTILLWNPCFKREPGDHGWEPRWEIWKELKPSRHPDATNRRYLTDEWDPDHQIWIRKLQTYETIDGQFAPADRALIIGLQMANAWSSRLWYEEFIEKPYDAAEERKAKQRATDLGAAAKYFEKYHNPIVGRHVNSGWRGARYGAM